MIRPEILEILRRWREPLLAGGALLLGLWFIALPGVGLTIVGGALSVAAVGLLIPAIRRVRLQQGQDGAGVVEITERQLTYLAAEGGGLLSLDLITDVRLADRVWHLADSAGNRIAVPADARGADALLDALLVLPGIDAGRVARALQDGGDHILWRQDPADTPALTPPA
ncbi:hypothetical protein AADZ90_001775 [Aestuariibius sp. 2305UL40-4]|uniref:hypothetical protein n=1 Tax=Aestuariibius violaceus TaxID=3234132 RepID=UPI00345ED7D1